MTLYAAPLEEMRFILYDVLEADRVLPQLSGHGDHGRDIIDAVLAEAGRFAAERLMPLNRSGDEEGCAFENGVVRTPEGFRKAYEEFARGGWTGPPCRYGDRRPAPPQPLN